MNSKPLAYDSLKTVLEYMDPNIRFLLSSRVPSIRTAERAVPLKIEEFEMRNNKIRINRTNYEFGIYQVDRQDNIPHKVSGLNKLNYKWTSDVDEFGIPDYITKEGGMLPGNNGSGERNLFGFEDDEIIPDNDGRLQKLERILETEKNRYKQLLRYRPKKAIRNHHSQYLGHRSFRRIARDRAQIYSNEELEMLKTKEEVDNAIEDTKNNIKLMENQILPFQNRRDNIRPKFEIYVRKSDGRSPSHLIERVNYTGDLHKAVESFINYIFSKRRHVIEINRLWTPSNTSMPRILKFKVKRLVIQERGSIESVEPIIEESSFPLEKVTIDIGFRGTEELDHEIIRTAKLLKIDVSFASSQLLQNVTHPNVEFRFYSFFTEHPEFFVLIRHYVETNKPIGTCYLFNTHRSEEIAISILENISIGIQGAIYDNKCVTIPMRNSTVLKLSCVYPPGQNYAHIKMTIVSLE
uniref:FTH domain-containing protein n=1 Tax=Caenorhabditis tropicalis TaxID=1561998 RepID=A0A1I7UDT3_9PELO